MKSALQIIALESFLHNPMFVFPQQVSEDEVACISYNFFGAFYRVMRPVMNSTAAGGSGLKSLGSISTEARDSNRCVVLFAEGARTNGDGVLRFAPKVCLCLCLSSLWTCRVLLMCSVTYIVICIVLFTLQIFNSLAGATDTKDTTSIHILGFQYPSPEKEFTPACPAGSFFQRLFWLASYSPFRPFLVKAEFVLASALKPFPTTGNTTQVAKQLEACVSESRDVLANILKKNKVDMGFDDYSSFCDYYKQLSLGNMKEASAIADARKKH
jgi:hypothetical protein